MLVRIDRLVMLVLLMFIAGCIPPVEMVWSPDGTRAGYWANDGSESYVIGEAGEIIDKLGPSVGGFAWTADSRRMYYGTVNMDVPFWCAPITEHERWMTRSPFSELRRKRLGDMSLPLAADWHFAPNRRAGVRFWQEGRKEILFHTDRFVPVYMDLSPDEQWLAVIGVSELEPAGGSSVAEITRLYVYSMRSHQIFVLSDACGISFCFTGANRLAYMQWNLDQAAAEWTRAKAAQAEGKDDSGAAANAKLRETMTAKLTEAVLDESKPRLDRKVLAEVPFFEGAWLCSMGEDIVFTGRGHPGEGRQEDVSEPALCCFSRASGRVAEISPRASLGITRSPDGQRLLFTQVTDGRAQLCLLSRQTGTIEPLAAVSVVDPLPAAWPCWRNNRQVVLSPLLGTQPPQSDGAGGRYDLALYDLADHDGLRLSRNLSAGWPERMKPCVPGRPRMKDVQSKFRVETRPANDK